MLHDFTTLEPVEDEVKINEILQGKKVTSTLLLREASEGAIIKWRNQLVGSSKLNEDGKAVHVDASGVAGANSLLVSLCLFEPGVKDPIQVERVRKWSPTIIKALYERVKAITPDLGLADKKKNDEELTKDATELEEAAKN